MLEHYWSAHPTHKQLPISSSSLSVQKIVVSNSTQKLFSSSAIPGVRKDGQLKEFCFCLAKDNLTTKQKSCLYYTSSSTLTPSSSSPNCCCWSALKTSCETLIGTQIVVRSWTYWQTRLFQINSLEDRETFPDQLDLRGFPDSTTKNYSNEFSLLTAKTLSDQQVE